MNILSYILKDDMIHLTTDHKDYKEFVYNKYKFSSKAALLAEMNKKVIEMDKRKAKADANLSNLLEDLNA